jgi:membrane associated rhomboid family serine protease
VVFLFLLLILGGIGYRLSTPKDRERLLQHARVILRELTVVLRHKHAELDPFRATLRARTKYVFLAPALVAVTVGIFVSMLFGRGALSAPATLIGWGANFGPRTTNGEWWRLLASTFVHVSFLRMVIEAAVLAQLGMFLERLVGRSAVAAVFCAAGVLAGLINVSAYPMAVTGGAAGAICGLYGLLIASIVRSIRLRPRPVDEVQVQVQLQVQAHVQVPFELQGDAETEAQSETEVEGENAPQPLIVPRAALLWLAPASVLFLASALVDGSFVFKADVAGLILGFAAGLALTGGITEQVPAPRRVLTTAAIAAAALVAYAIPMRGIADVRPDISRIIALEDQTAGTYESALERVNKGTMTPDALAQFIDKKIVPELEAADTHLRSIRGVPPEHRHLVANADEYLQLRAASWRLYAESWRNKVRASRRGQPDGFVTSDAGWHQVKAQFRADAATRGKAEGTERAALEALQRLKQA